MSEPEKHPTPAETMPDLQPVIGRERMAMEEELVRARELLRDGMAKLHGFFDALRASVNAQAGLLEKLSDESMRAEDKKATLHQLFTDHERVLSQSETAILGLQLEDVLGQLLEYTRRRADGLSNLAATLADAVDHSSLRQNAELHERLRSVVAEVDQRANDRIVSQESLGSGDIELF